MEKLEQIQETHRATVARAMARVEGQLGQLASERETLDENLAHAQRVAERARNARNALEIARQDDRYSATIARDRDAASDLYNRTRASIKEIQQLIRSNDKEQDARNSERAVLEQFLQWSARDDGEDEQTHNESSGTA